MRMYFWVILLSLLIFSERALAYVVTTNAEYKPMPYDVGKSEFKMTDKCAPTVGGFPPAFQCQGGFSRLVHIPNTALKRLLAYSVHINERAIYFRISGEKTVQLKHVKSGVLHTMKFRLTHVGSHAFQDPDYGGVNNYTYNGCSSIHQLGGGSTYKTFFYLNEKIQKSGGECYSSGWKKWIDQKEVRVVDLYFSYVLTPPQPLVDGKWPL